jgi:shikimate kinase
MPSNIIFIGYRASGKTSLGRKLADRLWKTFADVDQEACARFGNDSIAQIWAAHGEPEWRRVEAEVTRDLCAKRDMVIALGGGTPMQPGAFEAVQLAQNAVRIYLKCSAEELHRRIQQDELSTSQRPNLTSLGGGLEEIRAVLAEREPVYEALADRIFDVTHTDLESALRYIIERCL